MNGNTTGILPTVELATTNGNNGFAYPYPVMPMMGGFGGNGGFGGYGSDWIWVILLLALFGGNWGNNGNGGGFFGGNSFDNGFAWLSNGQKEIMNNTNNGFDTLHLSNQLEGNRDAINSLSNQLCNCCGDISQSLCNGFAGVNQTVNSGFANAEVANNARQIANMQQGFATQTAITGGINDLSRQFADCLTKISKKAKEILCFTKYKTVGSLIG